MTHPNPSPTRPEDDPTNPSHPSYIGDGWWVGSAGITEKTKPSPRRKANPMNYVEQLTSAYRAMAHQANYRPCAPSDGMGRIVGPIDTDKEAATYAARWHDEEQQMDYFIGCPSFEGRRALIYTVEAARLICGVSYPPAARLLRMAADELEEAAR